MLDRYRKKLEAFKLKLEFSDSVTAFSSMTYIGDSTKEVVLDNIKSVEFNRFYPYLMMDIYDSGLFFNDDNDKFENLSKNLKLIETCDSKESPVFYNNFKFEINSVYGKLSRINQYILTEYSKMLWEDVIKNNNVVCVDVDIAYFMGDIDLLGLSTFNHQIEDNITIYFKGLKRFVYLKENKFYSKGLRDDKMINEFKSEIKKHLRSKKLDQLLR